VLVPHSRYLVDAGDIPEELAAIHACSGLTAYSALKKALPLADGDSLLLIGAGGVGLQGLAIAQAMTGARIIVGDIDDGKLAHARGAGAAHIVNTGKDGALKEILELSGGGLAAAIDFVGNPETAGLGIGALRRGGTLVIVGLYGGSLTIPIVTLPFRNIAIRGSYVGNQTELEELLELVRGGEVASVPIARRPLGQASATLDDLKAGRITGRVVLTP
jgi:alcohol dehydrogenase/propanol-preferring alcohol dehydrogenase